MNWLATERFRFLAAPIDGLWRICRESRVDQRGSFTRFFCAEDFRMIGLVDPIVQINHSVSMVKGTVRGLHFQRPPHAETKIVTCLRGRVFDVAVDVRRHSTTFLCWHGIELSEDNMEAFLIPPGFAHGFQTVADNSDLIYLHTRAYAPHAEDGLRADDPAIGIDWPLPVRNLSDRDLGFGLLQGTFEGIEL